MSVSSKAFATAVSPVVEDTVIITDDAGLSAGDIAIPVADGVMPAYRAAPAGGGNHPVVLVVQEIFGIHEHIRDVCRRLAKAGYLAIAPALTARQGDVTGLPTIDDIRKIVSIVPDTQVCSDLDAAVLWARANGGDAGRLAVTGFCWGGRVTWLYAAHQPAVKAGVAWYGKLVGPRTSFTPVCPVEAAPLLKAPVLGLYGGRDDGIPQDTVEQMRAALRQAGGASDIHVYPDAPHGFYADYRPSYRKGAAEDGWRRMLAWFRQQGV